MATSSLRCIQRSLPLLSAVFLSQSIPVKIFEQRHCHKHHYFSSEGDLGFSSLKTGQCISCLTNLLWTLSGGSGAPLCLISFRNQVVSQIKISTLRILMVPWLILTVNLTIKSRIKYLGFTRHFIDQVGSWACLWGLSWLLIDEERPSQFWEMLFLRQGIMNHVNELKVSKEGREYLSSLCSWPWIWCDRLLKFLTWLHHHPLQNNGL